MIKLGRNIEALSAARLLDNSSNKLSAIFERLSSGQRINRAADDAAGLAIALSLDVQTRVFTQGIRNIGDGVSALSIADSAMNSLVSIVERQKELATQAANGVFSDTQRQALNSEAQALSAEYQRILDTTTFNGVNLFDSGSLDLQNGFGAAGRLSADILARVFEEDFELTGTGVYDEQIINLPGIGTPFPLQNTRYIFADINGNGIEDIVTVTLMDNGGAGDMVVSLILGSESGTYSVASSTQFQIAAVPDFAEFNLSMGFNEGLNRIEMNFNYGGFAGPPAVTGYINVSGGDTLSGFTPDMIGGFLPAALTGTNNADLNGDGIDDRVTGLAGGQIRIETQQTESTSLGVQESFADLTQQSFDISSQSSALAAIDSFEELLVNIQESRSVLGASLSRLDIATRVSQATVENYTAARGRILDADVAEDSSKLVAQSILQQAGAAVLANASLQPEIALRLLDLNN